MSRILLFGTSDTELISNGIKVLLILGQAYKNVSLIDLTAAEYKLLCLFMQNPNEILTKEQMDVGRDKERFIIS